MSTIYDGKLTAWLDMANEEALADLLPPVEKYVEGEPGFTFNTKNPALTTAIERLRSVSREYAAKQASGQYGLPVEVSGEVDHGCQD